MRWALRKHGFEELLASMLRLVRACEDIAAETNSACEACVLTPVWTKLRGFPLSHHESKAVFWGVQLGPHRSQDGLC